MSIEEARLTQQQRFALQEARSLIRDMAHELPEFALKELCERPEVVCEKLSQMLGEKYNFETGDPEDSE